MVRFISDAVKLVENIRLFAHLLRCRFGESATVAMSDSTEPSLPPEWLEKHVNSGSSSGAYTNVEDWVRENAREPSNDGRSPTRTMFFSWESDTYGPGQKHRDPSDRRSWRQLANWQDGVGSDVSRGSQNWWADKQRWTDTFADIVGATQFHREQTKYVLERIDMTPYRSAHHPAEAVILGILSLLIDSDITNFNNRTLAREGTKDLLDDLELTVEDYEDVRSLLRKNDKDLIFPD